MSTLEPVSEPQGEGVVLPVVALGATERLRDAPGHTEQRVSEAIARALVTITELAREQRIVLSGDHVDVNVSVEVRVDGVQVRDDIDIEDVRRHLPTTKPLVYGMAYRLSP